MQTTIQRKFLPLLIAPLIVAVGNFGCPPPPVLPPKVSVTAPNDGAVFEEGEAIRFTATAFRLGLSPDYVWTSSLQGVIGMAVTFQTTALVEGMHQITVTATVTDPDPDAPALGMMFTKTISVTIVAPGMGEGTGEGSGEGSGEGMGEGTGEGMGEGAGEADCVVQSFNTPITNLDFFDQLDNVDVEIDGNGVAHAFYIHPIVDFDARTEITQAIYLNPDSTLTVVAEATRTFSNQGETLTNPRIAITRMGSVFVQYLRQSSTVDDDWIAHKQAAGAKTFSAGFQAVQRVFPHVEAAGFTADLKAFGDDQAANAVVKNTETIGTDIEIRTRLEINVLNESDIDRTFTVADEMATLALDFSCNSGFVLEDPIAATGPNNSFSVIVSRRPCGQIATGQMYRLHRPEDTILTGPEAIDLQPITMGFLGPYTFDELGQRHQMRIAQEVLKNAKGTTTINSSVIYRRNVDTEIPVYETTYSDGITCIGDQLNFTPGVPGAAITVGPEGHIAVIFASTDCNDNISVLVSLADVLCSSP